MGGRVGGWIGEASGWGGWVGEVGGSSLEDIGFQPGQIYFGQAGGSGRQWGENLSPVPAPALASGLNHHLHR